MIDFYSFSKVYFFTAFFQSLLLSTSEQEHVNFLLFFLIIQIQIKEQKKICQCSNSIEVPCREHPAVNFTISLGVQSQDMMRMKLLMMMKMWVFCCPPCEMPYNMWSLNNLLRFTLFLLPLLLFLSLSSSPVGGCSCTSFTQSFSNPNLYLKCEGGHLLWSGIKQQVRWNTNYVTNKVFYREKISE